MVNYYKKFNEFKNKADVKDGMDMFKFRKELIKYFGFGGRNQTVKRWISNFEYVGLIKIEKVKGSCDDWIVRFPEGNA